MTKTVSHYANSHTYLLGSCGTCGHSMIVCTDLLIWFTASVFKYLHRSLSSTVS